MGREPAGEAAATPPLARWDTDRRGGGVTDGGWIAPQVLDLLGGLATAGWVAEDSEDHLLPNLRRACEAPASPWTLTGTASRDGVFLVDLGWARPEARLGRLRADVFALIGAVAESVSFVRQRVVADAVEYDIATGMLEGDSPFAAHGHLLRLRIGGAEVARHDPGHLGA